MKRRLILALWCVVALAFLTPAVKAKELADSANDWQGSAAQPHGQWEHGYYSSGTTYTSFTRNNSYEFYSTNIGGDGWMWDAPSNYPRWGEFSGAPHASYRAVRRWTSNVSGLITIHYDYSRLQDGGGNGFYVSVRHNGSALHTSPLLTGGHNHTMGSVTTTVAVGDKIDFMMDASGDGTSDWGYLRTQIDCGDTSPDSDLVLHYKLDETTDTPPGWAASVSRRDDVGDAGGNNNHGSLVSMDATTDWVAAKDGNGLDFDGGNDYVRSDSSSVANGATELTIACWINPDAIGNWDGLVTSTAGSLTGIALANYVVSYAPHVRIMNQGGLNGNTQIPLNQWTHVAITWKSGDHLRMYINGALDASAAGPSTTVAVSTQWIVGRDRLISGRYFDGTMDDVRIYTRALDAQEIGALGGRDFEWVNPVNGNWGTAVNWDSLSGETPTNAADRVSMCDVLSSDTTVTIDVNNAKAGELTIGGGTDSAGWILATSDAVNNKLTLDDTGAADTDVTLNAGGGSHTISAPVVIASGNQLTADVESGADVTISGIVSESGGAKDVRKVGGGTVVLSGANTFTGQAVAESGTLSVGHASGLGTTVAGTVVSNGATLAMQGGVTVTGEALALYGGNAAIQNVSGNNTWNGTVTMNALNGVQVDADTLTLQGTVAQSGGSHILRKYGAGKLVFDSTASFTGGLHFYDGTFAIGPNADLGGNTLNPQADNITITSSDGTSHSVNNLMRLGQDVIFGEVGTGDLSFTNPTTGTQLDSTRATLTVNNTKTTLGSGYTGTGAITKDGSGELVLTGSNNWSGITVVNEGTLTLNPSDPVTFANNFYVGQENDKIGTVHVAGGTVNFAGGYTGLGWNYGGKDRGKGILNQTAGTVTISTLAAGQYFANNQTHEVNVSGGSMTIGNNRLGNNCAATMTVSGSAAVHVTGSSWVAESGTGALNMNGGTFLSENDMILGAHVSATGVGVVNLNGGVLTVPSIQEGPGTGTVYFNGGTLAPSGSSATFLEGLTAAYVKNGGAVITNDENITIAQDLLEDAVSTGGGLSKKGSGTLTISGTSTYTGTTIVEGGLLDITTKPTGGGGYALNSNATITVTRDAAGGSALDMATLALGQSGSGTQTLNIVESLGVPYLNVVDNNGFTADGTTTINVSGIITSVGTYPLVQYAGTIQGAGFGALALGTVPTSVTAAHLNDSGTSIDLVVTAVEFPVWTGATDDQWDVATTVNWKGSASGSPMTFDDNDSTLFDDTATGTTAIDIPGTVQPSSVIVSNDTKTYTFNGTGKIGGTSGLIKRGAGTLNVVPANDYTGVTRIEGGRLSPFVMANGGVASSVGAASSDPANLIIDAGELWYIGGNASSDRGAQLVNATSVGVSSGAITLTLGGVLEGSGSLTKIGSGWLVLTGTCTYSGGTTVSGGYLRIGAGTSGSVVGDIVNNSWVEFDRSDAYTFSGAITGSGRVVKYGSGNVTLGGVSTYSGPTTVSAGTLTIGGSLGSTSVAVSGGTLAGGGTIGGPVSVTGGGTLAPGTSIGTLTINNTLALGGATTMEIDKPGGTPSADKVVGVTTLTLGGTLNVTQLGGILLPGDTFDLFDATTINGSFSAYNLPALGGGLEWDTSSLAVDGTITVTLSFGIIADSMAEWAGTSVALPHGDWDYGHYLQSAGYLTFTRFANTEDYGDWIGGDGRNWLLGGATTYPKVGEFATAPAYSGGEEYLAVRRWSNDAARVVTIHYDAKSIQWGQKTVSIAHNGTNLWSETLNQNVGEHQMGAIVRTVAPGDVIDFITDADGDQSADWTHFVARIEEGDTTPDSALVAHYTLDEGNLWPVGTTRGDQYDRRNTAGDSSGNNNFATLNYFSTAVSVSHWAEGKVGNGLNLDGSNDMLKTDSTSIGNGATELTLACWIRPDSKSNWDGLITTESTAADVFTGIALADYHPVNNTYAPTARIMNNGNFTADIDTPVGVWSHVVLVWKSGETMRFYINGELAGNNDAGAPSGTLAIERAWYIGRDRLDGGRMFDGVMDDVRIYTRALSGDEIAGLAGREFTWRYASSGNWNAEGEWASVDGGTPTQVMDTVIITRDLGADQTVTIDTDDATAGALTLGDSDPSHVWTVASSDPANNKLTMDNSGADPRVEVDSGTNIISAPMVVAGAGTLRVAVAADSELTLSGTLSESGGSSGLMKSGPGALHISSNATHSGATWVRGGLLAFDDGGSLTTDQLLTVGPASGESGTSTLSVASGSALTVHNGTTSLNTLVGNGTTGKGVINLSGGSLTVDNLILGQNASNPETHELNLSGGAFTAAGFLRLGNNADASVSVSGAASLTAAGNFWIGEGGTAAVSVAGGTVTSALEVTLGQLATGEGMFNLNGGALIAPRIAQGAGAGTFHFNGGTLRATSASVTFMEGIDSVTVKSGGAVVASDLDVTIAQDLLENGVSTGGGLTKQGSGTLTVSGAGTYTGTTSVDGGELDTTTKPTGAGAYSVADGTTLTVRRDAAGGNTLDMATATFGAGGADAQTLNIVENGGVPSLDVADSNGLTANGTTTINVDGNIAAAGTYPLIQYAGSIGGDGYAGFTLGTVPSSVTVANLADSGSSIDLVVTGVEYPIWTGATDDQWDVNSTVNWKGSAGGAPTAFQDGDGAFFDDTATGSTTIDVAETVQPSSVTVTNDTKAYTFGGSGKISGTAGLIKQGANTLTISVVNDYTGVTRIEGGTVSVGAIANGGVASPLGAASVAAGNLVVDGATLQYTGGTASSDRNATLSGSSTLDVTGGATTLTLGGVLEGGGALVKAGSGLLTLSGANTYGGLTTVNSGTLRIGSGTAGSVSGNIVNNAAVEFNRSNALTYGGTISGSGSVTQMGGGNLTLGGVNTYNGTTTVSAGTLTLNGSLGATAMTVSGGTLTGNGDTDGSVSVTGGGTLAPGTGIATLTINNTLALAGQTTMEIDRSGSPAGDKVVGITTLTQGGTLTVTLLGGSPGLGDTFDLFDATTFNGAFSSVSLPALGGNVEWDASRLDVDGTITVVLANDVAADSVDGWEDDGAQPDGQWEYGRYTTGYDHNTFTRNESWLTYYPDRPWYLGGSSTMWQGGSTRVSEYAMLPFASVHGVRRWTCNEAGPVTIYSDSGRGQGDNSGNGVLYGVYVNGQQAATRQITNGGGGQHQIDVVVTNLGVGDKVDFVVDARGQQDNDWTYAFASIARGDQTDSALAAHFRMDERNDMPSGVTGTSIPGGGTWDRRDRAGDSSGNQKHADLVNFSTAESVSHWVDGKIGNGLDFDGGNDVLMTFDTGIGNGATELTLACWIKPDSISNWDGLMTSQAGGLTGIALADYNVSYSPHVRIMNQGNLTANTQIPLNDWTHVAITWKSGDHLRIYIDGELDVSAAGPSTTLAVSTSWYIGRDRVDGGRMFDGVMDDARIYTRALGAEEIAALAGREFIWRNAVAGNWGAETKWSSLEGGTPDQAMDTVSIDRNLTADATVTIDTTGAKAGVMNLGGSVPSHGWTVGSSDPVNNKLTFDNTGGTLAGGDALLYALNDGHAISAPMVLASGNGLRADVGAGDTLALSGAITESGGSRGLLKLGEGTLLLNGTSTYGGDTIVTNGLLGGTGTVSSAVEVFAGIGAGSALTHGSLTTGNQTWYNGMTNVWEISDADGVAGTDWDLVVINGTLDLSGITGLGVTINVASLSGGAPGSAAGAFDNNETFEIVRTTGGISGFASNEFVIDTADFAHGPILQVRQIGNSLYLKVSIRQPTLFIVK